MIGFLGIILSDYQIQSRKTVIKIFSFLRTISRIQYLEKILLKVSHKNYKALSTKLRWYWSPRLRTNRHSLQFDLLPPLVYNLVRLGVASIEFRWSVIICRFCASRYVFCQEHSERVIFAPMNSYVKIILIIFVVEILINIVIMLSLQKRTVP